MFLKVYPLKSMLFIRRYWKWAKSFEPLRSDLCNARFSLDSICYNSLLRRHCVCFSLQLSQNTLPNIYYPLVFFICLLTDLFFYYLMPYILSLCTLEMQEFSTFTKHYGYVIHFYRGSQQLKNSVYEIFRTGIYCHSYVVLAGKCFFLSDSRSISVLLAQKRPSQE